MGFGRGKGFTIIAKTETTSVVTIDVYKEIYFTEGKENLAYRAMNSYAPSTSTATEANPDYQVSVV